MNPNFYAWGMAIGIVLMLGIIALVWWSCREPKPKDDPDAFAHTKDVASCDGCGCLLLKGPKYKQPSSVELDIWRNYRGGLWILEPEWKEVIREHYLCLRCQVDGVPPAKIAESIDEAHAAREAKAC